MNFDGIVGDITYEGEGINDWIMLLTLGSWLHVGSTATFGLGKYSIMPG
jgi:CRISPR/Cas system endoribonuclease Cas6 (RAMP superfamily)